MNCKNCKYWSRSEDYDTKEPLKIGTCSLVENDVCYYENIDIVASKIKDGMMDGDNLHTNENFGCIHYVIKDNHYQCEACGEIYEKGWTDEEAQKEAKENFGEDVYEQPTGVVCDDCYKLIMERKQELDNLMEGYLNEIKKRFPNAS